MDSTPDAADHCSEAAVSFHRRFYGVYLLISRCPVAPYCNRCYIGFTTDPHRRIRQHNTGLQAGGAKKTDSRGPWEMVLIVHGFPNEISALRFEWAWQQPDRSRILSRLQSAPKTKPRKQSHLQWRLSLLNAMLNSGPWNRLPLCIRWVDQELAAQMGTDMLQPPSHVGLAFGVVPRNDLKVDAAALLPGSACRICLENIETIDNCTRCPAFDCQAQHHLPCLANRWLQNEPNQMVPVFGSCPQCQREFLWADLLPVLTNQNKRRCATDGSSQQTGSLSENGNISPVCSQPAEEFNAYFT